MTHRVGIIGLGTVGSRFVEQFTRHDDFELVAAWDPDDAACAEHRDAVAIVADADAVITAADVVYIAVPPLWHREYVEACVAREVAIFCEKPLGIDVEESRALVDLVEASGLPAGVNFVFGGAPSAVGLADIVASGRLGDVVRGDLRLHFATWPRPWHAKARWLRLRDQGGWLREVASHFVFLANRLLGPLAVDTAAVDFADGPAGVLCEIAATAHLISADGRSMLVAGTSGGVGPDIVDFTIRGTEGSARIVDWYRLEVTDGGAWTESPVSVDAYGAQLDELSAMLRGDADRIATFTEALAVQELVEELLATPA